MNRYLGKGIGRHPDDGKYRHISAPGCQIAEMLKHTARLKAEMSKGVGFSHLAQHSKRTIPNGRYSLRPRDD